MNHSAKNIFSKRGSGKVLSFGELLLRICVDTEGDWLALNNLPFYVGGAEANVAAALALWGVPSAYLSRVPDNLIGRQLLTYLTKKGMDVSRMLSGGERLGLYFLPKGKDLKNAAVIYDRAHSSFSELKPGMIDWEKTLEGVDWLNFSAISPALNSNIADLCKEAAAAAKQQNKTVSLDLNYRAKLWQWGKEPIDVIPGLVPFCDVLMGNVWAAEKMLGIEINAGNIARDAKEAYLEQALQTSKNLILKFPDVKAVANTFRFQQQSGAVHYYATLFDADAFYVSAEYNIAKTVDSVGSGDCFMAGLIYGFYNNLPLQQTLHFATAAAVKKLSEAGDATNSTDAEIQKSIKDK